MGNAIEPNQRKDGRRREASALRSVDGEEKLERCIVWEEKRSFSTAYCVRRREAH